MRWQRIEKPGFGYAVHVPDDWHERPPGLRNSLWETARFAQATDRGHSLIVFRSPLRRGSDATEVAGNARMSLENLAALAERFEVFELTAAARDERKGAARRAGRPRNRDQALTRSVDSVDSSTRATRTSSGR